MEEKDDYRMSLIRRSCASPGLEKVIFKENFGRDSQKYEKCTRKVLARPRRRQVVSVELKGTRYTVNDTVSIREDTVSSTQMGMICKIDEIKVGKKIKRWFHVLVVNHNRYEVLKVSEKNISKVKIKHEQKATLSYGAILYSADKNQ